jgi:hypothetical protein
MEAEFGISQDNFPWLYWATASWNVGAAVFPLLFVPLTENTGRMPGYFGAYILFLVSRKAGIGVPHLHPLTCSTCSE